MEEKERFELFSEHCIKDNDINARCQLLDAYKACVVLNEQDKRIKELEATNKVLSNELTKNNIMEQDRLETCCGIPIYEIPTLKQENQQLKDRWQKLKDDLILFYTVGSTSGSYGYNVYKSIFDRMKEFE